MKAPPSGERHAFGGRTLTTNSIWNLLGQGAPLVVAVFAIPVLIHRLGEDRFGILTLGWAVVGYFGLFDLGLGRAVTKLVAQRIGAGEQDRIPGLVRTALLVMAGLGTVAGGVLFALAPLLAERVFEMPEELRGETRTIFRYLACALPFVVTTSGLRGVLEAHQRFGLVNAIRFPSGVFTFAAPLVVLLYSSSLPVIVAVLCAGRVAAWAAHVVLCHRIVPGVAAGATLRGRDLGELLSFGGWMAISNFVGPLLVYVDRFLIAAGLSTAAVAYYTTPHQVLVRFLLVPSSIVAVVFPAFSHSFASDPARARRLYSRASRIVAGIMIPLAAVLVLSARPLMSTWIDAEFAARSSFVAQVLAVGVAINALGLVSQAFVQGAGRPDLTAKLHLIELPLYVAYLWVLLGRFGIDGAAVAWTLRVSLSALALFLLARYTSADSAGARPETP